MISPLSKTVYPSLCEIYSCTAFLIERDIRHAIKKSNFNNKKPSPKKMICDLLDFANRLSYEMLARDVRSAETVSINETNSKEKQIFKDGKITNDYRNVLSSNTANYLKVAENPMDLPVINPYPTKMDYERFEKLYCKD